LGHIRKALTSLTLDSRFAAVAITSIQTAVASRRYHTDTSVELAANNGATTTDSFALLNQRHIK